MQRIAEHKNCIGKGDSYQSALYKHALENKHTIDYEGIEILDKANSDHKLLLKEMLYINKLKPTLNRQKNLTNYCKEQRELNLSLSFLVDSNFRELFFKIAFTRRKI